jgi:hypothetical protein
MLNKQESDNFSKWYKWEDRKDIFFTSRGPFSENEKCSEIYAIAISDENLSDKPFDINNKKIVYFGMTHQKNGLMGRLNQFDNSLQYPIKKGPGHGGADRMKYCFRDYDRLIPLLFVSVLPI